MGYLCDQTIFKTTLKKIQTSLIHDHRVLNAVTELSQDVEFDEILDRLYFLYKVETGLKQVSNGETLSHSEVVQTIKTWQK